MLLVFGVVLMVLGTYANLVALEHKKMENIVVDKLPKEHKQVEIKNRTIHSEKSKSSNEKIIEIPIEILPLPGEIKNKTIISSYQVIPNVQKSLENDKKIIVNTLPPPRPSINVHKEIVKPAPPAPIIISNNKSTADATAPAAAIAVVDINREALQHEDHEIAIENNAKQLEDNAVKIDETKELLNAQVDEIKKEFEKRNQETQKLVLEKFEQIAEKVEKIEQKQEKPQQLVNDAKSSHKLTMEKFEEMAEKMEKIVEHQEKEKFVDKQQAAAAVVTVKPMQNVVENKSTQLPGGAADALAAPSKDTEKLVLQKFEEIAERVERIEQHQELQKKEIEIVRPTHSNILKKFEKIAEKVMKIEQNQLKDDKIVMPPTTIPEQLANKIAVADREPEKIHQQPIDLPESNVVPQTQSRKNIVAPQLMDKFQKIDDYIDKIEQKQKEMETVQPPSIHQQPIDDSDKEDAQQMVLEKFEKIAERVEKIEQKQAEQKKIKTAATLDTVGEKLEKIVERVEKIEKIQKIEEIVEQAAVAPKNTENLLLEKFEKIADTLENTENVKKLPANQTKPASENIDPKIVLKKLDEIADKLENTKHIDNEKIANQNVVQVQKPQQHDSKPKIDEKPIEIPPQTGLDPKVVLEKLNQIAKAVEKIDQKNKINENPVVKMIIDSQKQNVTKIIEKRTDTKAVPVPVMLLNTSVAGNNYAKKSIEPILVEETENPIQAIRRDLLAIKTDDATILHPKNQTLRQKRSIALSNVNLPAFSLGAGIEMKMIGRGLKSFDDDETADEKKANR